MLRNPIVLPVYFNTEKTAELEKLDIETSYEDLDVRSMHFFNISSVINSEMEGKEGSLIYSDGEVFESPMESWEVLEIINKGLNSQP